MSKQRESISWQHKDGAWSIGFWTFFEVRPYDEDEEFDPEWDVEYAADSFWFASTGHPTQEAAMAAYTRNHPNPGSTSPMPYEPGNDTLVAELDGYAEKVLAEQRVERARYAARGRAALYRGW